MSSSRLVAHNSVVLQIEIIINQTIGTSQGFPQYWHWGQLIARVSGNVTIVFDPVWVKSEANKIGGDTCGKRLSSSEN